MVSHVTGKFPPPLMELPEIENSEIEHALSLIETQEALNSLTQILSAANQLTPTDHFRVLVGRAKVYLIRGTSADLQFSRTDLNKALDLLSKPGLMEIPLKTAEVQKYLALICIAENTPKEALDHYKKGWEACKSHKTLALDYIKFLKGDWGCVIEICDEVLREDPHYSEFLYARAKAHFSAEKWVEAEQDCLSYLATNNGNRFYQIEILDLITEICLKRKDYPKACEYMEKAGDLDTTLSSRIARSKKLLETRLLLLPRSFRSIGDYVNSERRKIIESSPEESLGLFEQLLDPNPSFFYLGVNIGYSVACIATKLPEKLILARRILNQTLPFSEKSRYENLIPWIKGSIFQYLARICILENKRDEALKYFERGYQVNPDSKTLFDDYVVFLRDQDPNKALELCHRAIDYSPIDGQAFYARAQIYFSLQRWAKALQDCDSSLKYANYELSALDLAAEICKRMGDLRSAFDYMLDAYGVDASSNRILRLQKILEMDKPVGEPSILAEENLSRLIDIANEADPEKGLRIFNYVLNSGRELSSFDHFRALLGRAQACASLGENLSSARQDLEQASLVLADGDFGERGEIFYCSALIDLRENREDEALQNCREAWNLCKSPAFIPRYLKLLMERRDFEGALKLCQEGEERTQDDRFDLLDYKCRVFVAQKDWGKVIQECSSVLASKDISDVYRGRFLDIAFEAYMEMEDFSKAEKCILEADSLDEAGTLLQLIKKLLKARKAQIVDEHLAKLSQAPNIRIPYISRCLETYQAELQGHSRHHVKLLLVRAKLYAEQNEYSQAIQDCEEIGRIFDSKPVLFQDIDRAPVAQLLKSMKKP